MTTPSSDHPGPEPTPQTSAPAAPAATPSADPLADLFPVYGLQICAGDLTMRVLREADFPMYAELLRQPIFDEDASEFTFPWYVTDPEQRVANSIRFQWGMRSRMSPTDWVLPFGVFVGDQLIGCQDLGAKNFAASRTVTTGSWLTQGEHGKGYGKLMRQAVLVLAFDHMGATRADTSALRGNTRSYAVSHRAGYADNGTEVVVEDGRAKVLQRFTITPERLRRPQVPVVVEGLTDELRRELGIDGADGERGY